MEEDKVFNHAATLQATGQNNVKRSSSMWVERQ